MRTWQSASQATPTAEASTSHPALVAVMWAAPSRKVISAPIQARVAARMLHDRSANDKNICRARKSATYQPDR